MRIRNLGKHPCIYFQIVQNTIIEYRIATRNYRLFGQKISLLMAISIATPSGFPTMEAIQSGFTVNPLIHPKLLTTKPTAPMLNSTLPEIDFQIDNIFESTVNYRVQVLMELHILRRKLLWSLSKNPELIAFGWKF
jgi:hypothetical protein